MSYEWLLIGFPIVFILGWCAARLDIRHIRKTAGELPDAYLRGLSQLLAKNEEKALDEFLRAPFIGAEPEEFQFAVGELSRRRGEHKRALRVHRRLYEQENQPPAVRRRALWELAQDYYHMGFVDFAEQHATPLLRENDYGERAFELLLNIHQRRRQYRSALELVESSGGETLLLRRKMVAQWHCQFARELQNAAEKRQLLEKALAHNPDCVHASLLLAEAALAQTPPDGETALRFAAAVEKQNPDYLWLAVAPLIQAQAALGDASAANWRILRWLADYPSPMLLRAARENLPAAAATSVDEQFLLARGGLFAAAGWAEHCAQTASSAPTRALFAAGEAPPAPAWKTLGDILRAAAGKPFTCTACGYEVNDFSWQCRGCLEWESLIQRNP